jgi:long-chain fatty acid transport protein
MRRFTWLLFAGVPSLLAAQGFGVYEHNTCTMGRAGVAAANPCADGSAIFFNPAGLAGLAGTHLSAGATLIAASGGFTDDVLGHRTDLDDPVIPVPAGYLTHQFSPKVTLGIGLYAPYGLQTRWPVEGFPGRFLGYDTKLKAIYVQPTIGYQLFDRLKVGVGVAYIHSSVELHQRVDLSVQQIPGTFGLPPGTTFAGLGIAPGTDFADGALDASGNGFAVNFGGILKVNDRLSIGGHWLTRRTITYDGTAKFQQILTNITLPPTPLNATPLPLDAVLAAEFGAGGPLDASGVAASTKITLPPQGTIGVAYKASDDLTLMMDYQYVVWGWFSSLKIDFQPASTPDITLTPDNSDTHGFRFGAEYQYSPKLTFRGGYLYHSASSPYNFVTPLLPEAPRNEFTIGLGAKLSDQLHADFAYQYIRQQDRRGIVVSPSPANAGLYQFKANLFGFTLAYTF